MKFKFKRLNSILNRINEIKDSSLYDASTRAYVGIGFAGIAAAYILSIYYLISDKGGKYNGLLILSSALALSVFMAIGLYTYKMRLAAILSSAWVSFILFPFTFFLSGGLNSGAPIWFLIGFVYVSLILSGRLRAVFFIAQAIVYSFCFRFAFLYPLFSLKFRPYQIAIDTLVSVVVAGPTIIIMFFLKERIMRKEQSIARIQKGEIERLTKSQQDFFSGMSRKIRTPIGGITGLNEMILRSDNLTEDIEKNTRNIVSASDMLLTIIEDIMDMNKMQIGDINIENLEYDSGLLFRDIINMLESKASEKGLDFIVDISPDFPVSLYGDKIRMKQILVNVLNNAIKYTKEGFVMLYAGVEPVGGMLVKTVYKVIDSGIGIKPENIDSLFSDFSRVDLNANRSIEGTGLGLSIVKGILSAMGGQIEVESTYGEGSVFTITLPQNKNGEETIGDFNNYKGKDTVREKNRFRLKGGRILIVDDDRMSREVVKKLLLNTGAAIDLCENGRQCLSLTAETVYNIIFMDHVMPGMDGVETFHRIRTQSNGKNRMTPIVALTANAGENIKEVYQNIGFAGYLSKPVNISLLEEYVIKSMPGELVEYDHEKEDEDETVFNDLKRKVPVIITTDSMAGISPEDITKLGIEVLPYCIAMPDGSAFVEGIELDIDSMRAAQYSEGVYAEVVNSEMAEDFFREQLKKAENIIHICIMVGDVSKNYARLSEVADKVGHVTVFESGTVSVGAGIMTVHAAKMASEGYPMLNILNELIELRKRIVFRTRIGEIDLLVRQGRFPKTLGGILRWFKMHPLIKTEDSMLKLYSFIPEKDSMEDFVDRIFKEKIQFEDEIYIAHPDVRNNTDEILKIKALVNKRGTFSNIVVVQSSPIMVANSGMNSLAVAMVRKHE